MSDGTPGDGGWGEGEAASELGRQASEVGRQVYEQLVRSAQAHAAVSVEAPVITMSTAGTTRR